MRLQCASVSTTLACLLFIACAATSSVEVSEPLAVTSGQYSRLQVSVGSEPLEADATDDDRDAVARDVALMQGLVLLRLRSHQGFDEVGAALSGEADVLDLELTMTGLRRVSYSGRGAVGALAGRAGANFDVVLRDRATGAVLGSGTVSGKSSGGTVMAGTTNQAIEQAADGVIEFLGPVLR